MSLAIWICIMSLKKTCSSCKYNCSMGFKASSFGWCLLRKIKVSTVFAKYAFCHHWSDQSNVLSTIKAKTIISEQQLDFARELALKEQ